MPALIERDKGFIRFAAENDLDFIGQSFVRNKEDVLPVQNILDENNSSIKKINKIENFEAAMFDMMAASYVHGLNIRPTLHYVLTPKHHSVTFPPIDISTGRLIGL
jgi:hypothetical protein